MKYISLILKEKTLIIYKHGVDEAPQRERDDDVATWLYQHPVRSLVEATCPPIEKSPPDKKATKA